MEDLKNGDYHHMETILGNGLYDILKQEVDASPTLPNEFLKEAGSFDCIPILLLDKIEFFVLPDGLVTEESTDHTDFYSYLKRYESMKKSDADELIVACKKRIVYYRTMNRKRGPFRIVWIPEDVSSAIKIMRTQIHHLSKPSFIYSTGVTIPINVDVRLQQLFFQQMIQILFRSVPFYSKPKSDDNSSSPDSDELISGDVSKLKFGYHITKAETILYIFISYLG
jgi:hypothetical protein